MKNMNISSTDTTAHHFDNDIVMMYLEGIFYLSHKIHKNWLTLRNSGIFKLNRFPNFGLGTVSSVTFFLDLSKIRACISISCQKFATKFLIRSQIQIAQRLYLLCKFDSIFLKEIRFFRKWKTIKIIQFQNDKI